MKEKYTYTGPTMLLGENEEFALRKGMEVFAEVNIYIAKVKVYLRMPLCLNPEEIEVEVAAKYLKPVKPDTIRFDPKDDESDKESSDSDTYYTPRKVREYLEKIQGQSIPRKEAEEIINGDNDGHEIGGTHYGRMAIEPWDYIYANHIPFDEGSAIKYLCRHKDKNGAEDVKKAISFCKHILKTQYGIEE